MSQVQMGTDLGTRGKSPSLRDATRGVAAAEAPDRATGARPRLPSRARGPAALAMFALAFAAVGAVAFGSARAGRFDAEALLGFLTLARPQFVSAAHLELTVLGVWAYAGLAVVLVLGAAWRRGLRHVMALMVGVGGANLGAELVKLLVPAHGTTIFGFVSIGSGAFPSGHATAAMSLLLGVLLTAPAPARPLIVGAGGFLVLAAGYAMPMLAMHYPSDVVGGYLFAGLWMVAGLTIARPTPPPHSCAGQPLWAACPHSYGVAAAWGFSLGVVLIGIGIALAPGRSLPIAVAIAALVMDLAAMVTVVTVAELASAG